MATSTSKRLCGLLAWGLWISGVLIVAVGTFAHQTEESIWGLLSLALGGLAFGLVGLVLALKTGNSISWLLLGLQIAFGTSPLGIKGPELILIAALLLLFPTGRLPSTRWRWAIYALGLAGLLMLADVFLQGDTALGGLVSYGVIAASGIRIIVDYRGSNSETRLQLKWIVWVLGVGAILLAISALPIPYVDDVHEVAGLVLTVGSPIAIGFAVAKYRLYEVDRLISQTVSYMIIVLALTLVLAAGSVWIPQTIGIEEPLAVAASTLAVAAGFNSLRRRVQRAVDRRFNRSKYDHERVAEGFSTTLRDNVDLQELLDGWIGVVAHTMRPRVISVWTKVS